jgi:hypothetical protein
VLLSRKWRIALVVQLLIGSLILTALALKIGGLMAALLILAAIDLVGTIFWIGPGPIAKFLYGVEK